MKGKDGKKEKRSLKHGAFLAKIQKSQPSKPTAASRRPKNIANLQALADALPDFDPDLHHAQSSSSNSVNVIRQKTTLRHKPGAQKRRQKLEKLERDRFASNMAQMASKSAVSAASAASAESAKTADPAAAGTADRWAALRSFISQTMEHQPVFQGSRPT